MDHGPDLHAHLENYRRLDGTGPATIDALRTRALAQFAARGFPSTRLEDWRFTDVTPIAQRSFALAEPLRDAETAAELTVRDVRLPGAIELVFVNGHFAPALSSGPPDTPVYAGSLGSALRTHPELIEPHLGRYAGYAQPAESLTALNTAFVRDGAFVYLPVGTALAEPVHCIFVAAGTEGPIVSHPRTLILVGEGASAVVVEQFVGSGEYWTNAVTEAVVGADAQLTHYKVQRDAAHAFHVGTLAVAQAGGSRLASHVVSLGAALARSDVRTALAAPGAHCTFDGLYLAAGAQHLDQQTTIDHRQPRGTSRELYKGILDGAARGVFNGRVYVRPHAQQSDAEQMNQNLLLSDDAQIDTKPQLEIFADDVKCSHGATIGQLDEDAVFYLRSRGIAAERARELLIFAFANELIERIALAPLREQLAAEIRARLQGDAA
jgi:Fe-S cluster assembly protein SufD